MIRSLAAATVAVLVLGACGLDRGPDGDAGLKVATTLYPATFLIDRIGGTRVGLVEVQPRGAEAHDLELTSGQVRELSDADLVVYAGSGFQPAVEEAVTDLPDERRFDILAGRARATGPEDDHGNEAEGHDDLDVDPHVWLSLEHFPDIAEELAEHLAELDPPGAPVYRDNATRLIEELGALDEEFRDGLERCERREIVVAHRAFGYLAERYDLEEVAFAGLDPDAEPSPARLAEITEFARERGVTTIFYEELTSPAAAETLADELGIETLVLSPLETRPDDDYLSAMRNNLVNLRAALGCD